MSKGGIGRLIHNYIIWNRSHCHPADIRVLMLDSEQGTVWSGSYIEGLTVYYAESMGTLTKYQQEIVRNLGSPTLRSLHKRSLLVSNAIERLATGYGVTFDFIEFPDFMGLAYASIMRKKEGNPAFQNSALSVRLHSSMTLIQADEGPYHNPSEWFAAVTDIERYCLLNADVIIGHLQSIVNHNRTVFGFEEDWLKRCYVEFPPIFLTAEELAGSVSLHEASASAERQALTFIFSSRLQPFKRPEFFLQAAAAYLRSTACPNTRFIIAAYGWNNEYNVWLKSLIPDDLRDQIFFLPSITPEERSRLLANSVIVIPSTFESLCLFAYESLLYGRRLILNEKCLAFGKAPFWKDGENCIMFDGTVAGLCDAMRRANSMKTSEPSPHPDTTPYWDYFVPPKRTNRCQYSLDLIVTRVSANLPPTEDIEPYLEAGVRHAFQFVDRLYSPRPATPLLSVNSSQTVIENYGVSLEAGSLHKALRSSDAEYIFLTSERSVPSTAWRQFIQSGAFAIDADIIAFSTVDALSGKRQTPLLDCPNLLSLNLNFQVLPAIIRKKLLLEALDEAHGCDGWLVESLLIKLAFAGARAHVLDIPVVVATQKELNRFPLYHYTANILSAERRKGTPQLAAYSGLPLQPVGHPYIDEWSALNRPYQARRGTDGPLSRAGVMVKQITLKDPIFLVGNWRVSVELSGVETNRLALKDIFLSLSLNSHGLEITFHAITKENGTRETIQIKYRYTPIIFRSWTLEMPEEFIEEVELGYAMLHVVLFVADRLPAWCTRTYRQVGLFPEPLIEEQLFQARDQTVTQVNAVLPIIMGQMGEKP